MSVGIPFRCAQCGVEFAPGAVPGGLCPRCLLQLALGGESDASGGFSHKYRLVSLLGEGETGTTYLAERVRPIPDLVAIRALKVKPSSRLGVTRLESWRRTLDVLAHPNVARVLDTGVTDDGKPYIVREYVPGLALTKYCGRLRLGTGDRLRLVTRVCEAIEHAHAHGVMHGRIKSPNVLVFKHNEAPVPKVVDFGIASLTAQPGSHLGDNVSHDVCALGDLLDSLVSEGETQNSGHVGARLASVVKRARQSDPGRRYKLVAQLTSDLRSLLQGLL